MNKLKWSATVVALVVLAGIARLAAEGPSGAIRVTYSSDGSVPRAPGLSISYRSGDPAPQPILAQVASSLGSIPFDVSVEGAAWLSVTASSYITPATLTITANPAGLTPGTYSGSYTVHTAVASGGRIFDNYDTSAITLIVQPPPASTPSASPTSLTFNGTAGQPVANQTFNLSSAPSALGFSVTPAATWLGVSSGAGVTAAAPGTPVTVSVTTAGLSAGIYQSSMAVHLPGGTPAVLNIPVTLNLQAPPNRDDHVAGYPGSHPGVQSGRSTCSGAFHSNSAGIHPRCRQRQSPLHRNDWCAMAERFRQFRSHAGVHSGCVGGSPASRHTGELHFEHQPPCEWRLAGRCQHAGQSSNRNAPGTYIHSLSAEPVVIVRWRPRRTEFKSDCHVRSRSDRPVLRSRAIYCYVRSVVGWHSLYPDRPQLRW